MTGSNHNTARKRGPLPLQTTLLALSAVRAIVVTLHECSDATTRAQVFNDVARELQREPALGTMPAAMRWLVQAAQEGSLLESQQDLARCGMPAEVVSCIVRAAVPFAAAVGQGDTWQEVTIASWEREPLDRISIARLIRSLSIPTLAPSPDHGPMGSL